jgi:TetR/AcrR family transcriptional repressor of nem operon
MSRSPVKEQILEVATRLMAVRGYHRTALDDVLRESGAGKGNFYHYFRSKEDLGYAHPRPPPGAVRSPHP